MFSSCIGSFSLFNQYAEWQREMSDNKYINAILWRRGADVAAVYDGRGELRRSVPFDAD